MHNGHFFLRSIKLMVSFDAGECHRCCFFYAIFAAYKLHRLQNDEIKLKFILTIAFILCIIIVSAIYRNIL